MTQQASALRFFAEIAKQIFLLLKIYGVAGGLFCEYMGQKRDIYEKSAFFFKPVIPSPGIPGFSMFGHVPVRPASAAGLGSFRAAPSVSISISLYLSLYISICVRARACVYGVIHYNGTPAHDHPACIILTMRWSGPLSALVCESSNETLMVDVDHSCKTVCYDIASSSVTRMHICAEHGIGCMPVYA